MFVYEKVVIYLHCKPSCIEKAAYGHMLITHKIMHHKDALCKTEESPERIKGKIAVFDEFKANKLCFCRGEEREERELEKSG